MAKQALQADVLVLGEHPAAYLAAALLRHKSKLTVLHSTVPGQGWPDRLVRINPALFELHDLLAPLKRKLRLASTYGLQFLSQDGQTRSEYRSRGMVIGITSYKQVRTSLAKLAEQQGVQCFNPRTLEIQQVDEAGADVQLGSHSARVRALIVACDLPADQRRLLTMPSERNPDLGHRYAWVRLRSLKGVQVEARPPLPVSLDLFNQQASGWMLLNATQVQLGVIIPNTHVRDIPPERAMQRWMEVLEQHGILTDPGVIRLNEIESLDLPLAGALSQEGVANRTLLIGPAGGFFSASGEDIYPNCWSALYAVEVMRKALKERHLQDALGAFRARWRTTLGDYLRGPQQNLRFLLPLVYRNEVMTARLAEAILLGKSVVR